MLVIKCEDCKEEFVVDDSTISMFTKVKDKKICPKCMKERILNYGGPNTYQSGTYW